MSQFNLHLYIINLIWIGLSQFNKLN